MGFASGGWPFLGRLVESPAFQSCGRSLERVVKERRLDVGIDRHNIQKIDRPAIAPGTSRGGPVGDSLHLLQVFTVESSQEECIGDQTQIAPGIGGGLGAAILGQLTDESGDLRRHQAAVLKSAFVGFSFDVQHCPAGLRVTIARPIPLDRHGIRVKTKGAGGRGRFRRATARRNRGQNEDSDEEAP